MKTEIITVKVDKKTKTRLNQVAELEDRAKADIIRDALDDYVVKKVVQNKTASLSNMAARAKTKGYKGPKDLSSKLDKYLYE